MLRFNLARDRGSGAITDPAELMLLLDTERPEHYRALGNIPAGPFLLHRFFWGGGLFVSLFIKAQPLV